MALWNYCAICGKRIEVGDPCIGLEKSSEFIEDSICLDCAKIENFPDGKEPVSITDLLARVEAAEARAEKADRERDAAVEDISDIFARIDDVRERIGIENADADNELAELCAAYCSNAGKMCYKRGESCKCENFKWRG